MTVPISLAAALPGALITAYMALAFCGLKFRRAVNAAALLGAASVGLTFAANRFDMGIWIQALLLLCLGGVVLVPVLCREAALRAAPGAVLFCALRLIDRGAAQWLMTLEPNGLKIALGTVWLILLICGLLTIHVAFSWEAWDEAMDGQEGPGGRFRLTISLVFIDLVPLIALLPLESLLAQLSIGAGCALIGTECALLSAAVLSCHILLRVGQQERRLMENAQTQQELNHFMTIIRSQRHDYNLHLHTIAGLLGEGRYEESRKYIADVVADSRGVNVMMKIKEPMIGALISGYRDLAREQGCELDVCIADDLGSLVSTPYDTNRIIGNLLQNALDETSQRAVQDKRIYLETLRRGGNCVICVSNAVRDTQHLERLFECGHSSKAAHEGIGLNSVMRILDLYKGSIYYELTGDRVKFVVRIPSRI